MTWTATIKVGKRNTNLGTFATEEAAARAYDAAAREAWGEFAFRILASELPPRQFVIAFLKRNQPCQLQMCVAPTSARSAS